MPVFLDNSRAFTDYRSSRRINQDLKDQCQGQAVGVCLNNTSYAEIPVSGDDLLTSTLGMKALPGSPYDMPRYVRPRE
jgi:hypothetical protein